MFQIELTDSEARTLRFYLDKAVTEAACMAAIGISDGSSEKDLKSVIRKIKLSMGGDKGGV